MKSGEIELIDKLYTEFEISLTPYKTDFTLSIYIDSTKTLSSQLKNKRAFETWVLANEEYNKSIILNDSDFAKDLVYEAEKQAREILNNFDKIFDNVEYIRLSFENISCVDYIKSNPILLTKKIVINDKLLITDYDKLINLLNTYGSISEKIYINLENNEGYISLVDCYKIIKKIKDKALEIKSLNLSCAEEVMYVYDYVRNRVYKRENKGESSLKSRDLSNVLFGDEIVCVGYANIFGAILSSLGIKNNIVKLHDLEKNVGHARNVIYINDPKYNIDGVYYFDPTFDSKRNNLDNSYLYSYKYFFKTKSFMDKLDGNRFNDINLTKYTDDIYEKVEKIIKSKNYEMLIPYLKSISYMSRLVLSETLINICNINKEFKLYGKFNDNKFLKDFKKISKKFNKEISAEVMMKLISNVRKIENYIDPYKYPYSINDMYKIFLNSSFNFSKIHLSEKEKLIFYIFNVDRKKSKKADFMAYGNESNIFLDIERNNFTKTLKKVLNKRQS